MALQPNMQILNNASRDFVPKLVKLQNIPALAQGAEIIQVLDAIRTRLDNFNTHFDNLDTRLGQIDTRLDRIENRVKAADRNQIARVINSSCTTDTGILTALVNVKTGEPIPDFPVTVQAIRNLRGRSIHKCLRHVLILSMQATN
ncbi:hypothetical protein PILCRDRAFT_830066 [Piloderma croceum F 1598]|uniref:Uncharacterized protein n=1 Tax=Piloderma croceum (strain F 1598) TaxID=765440 RepID=A0A0C3B3S1_PILCF|nr:hypothetical protein PILCRDRAFT_830066 [Piloderma croceum F 1598]